MTNRWEERGSKVPTDTETAEANRGYSSIPHRGSRVLVSLPTVVLTRFDLFLAEAPPTTRPLTRLTSRRMGHIHHS